MSLFLIAGIDDRNVESPILTLARSVDRVAQEIDLARMNHDADLRWVLGELKAILAAWPNEDVPTDEPLNFGISVSEVRVAVIKDRVQHLSTALAEKIKENST